MAAAQDTVVKAFGLGTSAFALWLDLDARRVRVRHYDARMVVPLSWDEDGVSECAFVTRAFYRGKAVDQLQMHLRGGDVWLDGSSPSASSHGNAGLVSQSNSASSPSQFETSAGEGTYRTVTVFFDHEGNEIAPVYETGFTFPTFSIIKPAVMNTRVDMSPYRQSVFADAVDAIQAVDLIFDAIVSEIDLSKMRVFLSDVMFDKETSGGKNVVIPFGKGDCTVFRKIMSTDDMIHEFAPALRTNSQAEAFRLALQTLGDMCGFGIQYFDYDKGSGYLKTATEVASDNSALLRNIRRHENALESALRDISRAVLAAARGFGESIPAEAA